MANANTKVCCVSGYAEDECHGNRFRADKSMHETANLSKEDVQLLCMRVPGLGVVEDKSICDYHYKSYVKYYSLKHIKCCDPWNQHKKIVTNESTLTKIDLELAQKVKKICNLSIIPGQKICQNCKKNLMSDIKTFEEKFMCCADPFARHRGKTNSNLVSLKQEAVDYLFNVHKMKFSLENKVCNVCSMQLDAEMIEYEHSLVTNSCASANSPEITVHQQSSTTKNTPEFTQGSGSSEFVSDSQKKRSLGDMLDHFGMSPFKRQKLSDDRTVKKAVNIVQDIVYKVSDAFESCENIVMPKMNITQMSKESSWFMDIITHVQEKYQAPSTTFNEKISLLTLLPKDWKFAQHKIYIKCSAYMVKEAKKLRESIGVFGQRKRKTYLRYSPEVRKEIEDFYLEETNSLECSGAKEKVTVKLSGQPPKEVQKRVMLFDQKDLYNDWKEKTTQTSIPCLAFFCQLQPTCCCFAGEPGTHNICICCVHQNIKLKISVVSTKITYKQAIIASVCSIDSKSCMLRECSECPSQDDVYTFLSTGIDIEKRGNVKYSMWGNLPIYTKSSESSSMARMSLLEINEPFKDVLESTAKDIFNLTEHHFISLKQKEHYSQNRKEMNRDTGVFGMDFAENHSFIAQNSIQGLYFNNLQATLFTAILYFIDTECNDFSYQSYCVISNSKVHQAYSIHAFQEAILNDIKKEYPWIKKMIYYSDGAPTQFKNKNHLINLCYHENDFGIKAESQNFFGTSHGKSAADGIGAAAKRSARKAALQGTCIMDAKQMFDYLSTTDSEIKYLYVSQEEVETRGQMLKSRFNKAKTIKDTRKYHYFEPMDLKTMKVKLFSFDTESEVVKIA